MDSAAKRKQFWEAQAAEHGSDFKAVNNDPVLEELSTKEIIKLIPDGLRIADVGCGNGVLTKAIAAERPNCKIYGFDSSEKMIAAARAGDSVAIHFNVLDIAEEGSFVPRYDIVLGRRLLINLNYGEKLTAIGNIRAMLKPLGKYVMCECWQNPLDRINEMRKVLGHEAIPVRSVNEYLTEEFARELWLRFQPTSIAPITYGNLYYYISRVFNAGGDYLDPINMKAKKLLESGLDPLSSDRYGFCPESIWVMRPR